MRRKIAAGIAVLTFGAMGVVASAAPSSAGTPTPQNPLGCSIGIYLYTPTPVNLICLHL